MINTRDTLTVANKGMEIRLGQERIDQMVLQTERSCPWSNVSTTVRLRPRIEIPANEREGEIFIRQVGGYHMSEEVLHERTRVRWAEGVLLDVEGDPMVQRSRSSARCPLVSQ